MRWIPGLEKPLICQVRFSDLSVKLHDDAEEEKSFLRQAPCFGGLTD